MRVKTQFRKFVGVILIASCLWCCNALAQADSIDVLRHQAEGGDAEAQYNLGHMYEYGDGVANNDEEAMRWYHMAADKGLAKAQGRLGLLYFLSQHDYTEALKWEKKAAESGDTESQITLAAWYMRGEKFPRNRSEAIKWYRLAAESGSAEGQYMLGAMYYTGKELPRDYAEAMIWLRRAAEQNDFMAQSELGEMYSEGKGVPRDYVSAYMWLSLAAAQDDHRKPALDEMEAKLSPDELTVAQKLAHDWQAAHGQP